MEQLSSPLRIDNILRWSKSVEIVVLVLWDVSAAIGWYDYLSHNEFDTILADVNDGNDLMSQSFRFPLSTSTVFDVGAAELIAWDSRLEHAATRHRDLAQRAEEARRFGDESENYEAAAMRVCIDAMRDIGILRITEVGDLMLSEDFKTRVHKELAEYRTHAFSRELTKTADAQLLGAGLLACVSFTNDVTGTGLKTALVSTFAAIIGSLLLKDSYPGLDDEARIRYLEDVLSNIDVQDP